MKIYVKLALRGSIEGYPSFSHKYIYQLSYLEGLIGDLAASFFTTHLPSWIVYDLLFIASQLSQYIFVFELWLGWYSNEVSLFWSGFIQALVLKYLLFVFEDDTGSDQKGKAADASLPTKVGKGVHSEVLDSKLVFSHAQRTRYKFFLV